MPRTAFLLMKATVPISLALVLPLTAAAAPSRLIFRSVHVSPHPVGAGESMRITVNVMIEGGPMNPTAVVEAVPSRPGPPPPVIVLGNFQPGNHMIDVFRYIVPTPTPERACLNISLPGGQLRDLCFKRFKGSDGRWWMDVDTPGHWAEIPPAPTPAGPAPSGSPDLTLVGNIMTDSAIRLRNIGTVAATNISVRKACFYRGSWIPVGGDSEVRLLNIGEERTLKLGKLGAALGTCPPGSTQVRITADPGNRIAELDENNNTLEGGTLAELGVVGFKVDYPTTGPHAGTGPRVSFTVTNTGADAGRFAWDVSIEEGLSGERTWKSARGESISGLAAGQRLEVDVLAPEFRRLGGQRARVRVDPLNQVPETNENNNFSITMIRRPPT